MREPEDMAPTRVPRTILVRRDGSRQARKRERERETYQELLYFRAILFFYTCTYIYLIASVIHTHTRRRLSIFYGAGNSVAPCQFSYCSHSYDTHYTYFFFMIIQFTLVLYVVCTLYNVDIITIFVDVVSPICSTGNKFLRVLSFSFQMENL